MAKSSVFNYLLKVRSEDGVVHLTLIDPDPLKQTPEVAGQMAKYAYEAGTDAIMVGGSTAFGILDETVKNIKDATGLPVILFPGNVSGISKHADAVFFMSVLNSRNPYFISKAQALSSFAVKLYGLEPIGMAYLIVEPGGTAGYIGEAALLPRSKPAVAAAYALAAQYMGFRFVITDAGSNPKEGHIPLEMVTAVSSAIDVPYIVAGGIRTPEEAKSVIRAGADIVQVGTSFEKSGGVEAVKKFVKAVREGKK